MKKWNILNSKDSNIIDALLENRGVFEEERESFLNPPKVSELLVYLPQDFKDSLTSARKLILEAISNNTSIVIYGDYDADGVCATAILFNTLYKELNYAQTTFFIPNRFDHGYGMSTKALDQILGNFDSDQKLLFITVDTGITATKEIEYLKQKGHSVVITDHHQKPSDLPKADVILWNDQVVGSTISWILSKALGSKNYDSIQFAGIATITDLQAVKSLNRSIVKEAIEVLNSRPHEGIKKLIQFSAKNLNEISTYEIGWIIGPRLNASGRLVDAYDALKLLTEDDLGTIDDMALKLNSVNSQRQDKTVEMYEIASFAEGEEIPKIIISSNENYHEGIIGLVAARLMQKYYRPTIVISLTEEFGKGSVRSVPGVNIIEYLRKFEDLFTNLGGHPMAAGFTIPRENIFKLEKKIKESVDEHILDEVLVPSLDIDLEIGFDQISDKLLADLDKLKPFGTGNLEPIFLTKSVGVVSTNLCGKENQHIQLRLYQNDNYFKAMVFNEGERVNELPVGEKIDIVYVLKENRFNGKTTIDLIIKDWRKSS